MTGPKAPVLFSVTGRALPMITTSDAIRMVVLKPHATTPVAI